MMKFFAVLRCAAGYLFGAQACRKRQQVQKYLREYAARESLPYSGAKVRRTLPGCPAIVEYPDPTNTIPPATVGPGAMMDPPFAATLLTVSNVRAVSYRHSSPPSAVDTAIRVPSEPPTKATPAMTVVAAPWLMTWSFVEFNGVDTT